MPYFPTNYRYDKKDRLIVSVPFNRKTEPELLEWIERKENRSRYIKDLIEADIERQKEEENK